MRWLAMFCFSAAGAILALQYAPRWAVGVVAIAAAAVLLFGLRRPKPKRTAALLLACGIASADFTTRFTTFCSCSRRVNMPARSRQ